MVWFRRAALGLVIVFGFAYTGGMVALYFLQRDLQYDLAGEVLDLGATALTTAEVVEVPTGGGQKLGGWFAPPTPGRPLIVYFRGNSGSFTREHERFAAFEADGYGFLAVDYRGFPASPGAVSEENVLVDALAAFDFAASRAEKLVIWGRSLGSGPAAYVASRREAQALLLETPFDSAVAVARGRYGFFPVDWLMVDQYRVDLWLAGVTEPVFAAIAGADRTVPPAHGERAYALAPHQAGMWNEPNADHSDLWARGLWARARAFFAGTP